MHLLSIQVAVLGSVVSVSRPLFPSLNACIQSAVRILSVPPCTHPSLNRVMSCVVACRTALSPPSKIVHSCHPYSSKWKTFVIQRVFLRPNLQDGYNLGRGTPCSKAGMDVLAESNPIPETGRDFVIMKPSDLTGDSRLGFVLSSPHRTKIDSVPIRTINYQKHGKLRFAAECSFRTAHRSQVLRRPTPYVIALQREVVWQLLGSDAAPGVPPWLQDRGRTAVDQLRFSLQACLDRFRSLFLLRDQVVSFAAYAEGLLIGERCKSVKCTVLRRLEGDINRVWQFPMPGPAPNTGLQQP